ncbi:hypothetical protein VNO80_22702 [Phaseolus coccineus]|uniref:Uncharacterized protein n=1 Tax=Phaseolus coccineus TaxID=3886 RepID=A0AAN9QYZ8_PHACN
MHKSKLEQKWKCTSPYKSLGVALSYFFSSPPFPRISFDSNSVHLRFSVFRQCTPLEVYRSVHGMQIEQASCQSIGSDLTDWRKNN